jgi:hypothetical protein
VRFLQKLGQNNNIDFFTRMKTIVLNADGTFEQKDFSEVDPSREDQLIFNPTVLTSSQMPQLFTKPEESPMKKLLTYSGTSQR